MNGPTRQFFRSRYALSIAVVLLLALGAATAIVLWYDAKTQRLVQERSDKSVDRDPSQIAFP